MADQWHIVRVRDGGEDLAAEWFAKRLGLETYYPVAKRFVRPRWRKSKKPLEIDTAVFRGYLFIRVPRGFDWRSVWLNPHFTEFCFGGPVASQISDDAILEIRRCEVRGDYVSINCSDRAMLALLNGRTTFIRSPFSEEFETVLATVIDVVDHTAHMEVRIIGGKVVIPIPVHEIFPELFDNSH
jgi:hypothetical protein